MTNNLHRQLTHFVGRVHELEDIKRLIGQTRLLTLMGPGGIGKTRIAIQAAADLLDLFPDGVYLVELASITEEAMVAHTVASVMGVQTCSTEAVVSTLADHIGDKDILLLLDNCEHVVSACADLAANLLRYTERTRIIATSREILATAGEVTWQVPPLSMPSGRHLPTVEQLMTYESVQLFTERACAVKPDFEVTQANASAVAEICSRLDGIPLAIELAAARMNVLSPDDIATRLKDRFRLLAGRSRTVLPRQQTLRAMVDWSFDLLTDAERIVWRRLSVFSGSFSLQAAEAIISDDDLDTWEVLEYLTRLVEKSLLLTISMDDGARYRMLETIREYGEEKLQETGEQDDVRGRWWNYYAKWCADIYAEYTGTSEFQPYVVQVRHEEDNLLAALDTAVSAQDTATAMDIAVVLGVYWFYSGDIVVGRGKLSTVLALPDCSDHPLKYCRILSGAGFLALTDEDVAETVVLLEKARDLAGAADVPLSDQIRIVFYLGQALSPVDISRARSCFIDMLNMAGDDPHWAARAHAYLGTCSFLEGDLTAATRSVQQAETFACQLPGTYMQGFVDLMYAYLLTAVDDWDSAHVHARMAVDGFREAQSMINVVNALIVLAFCEEWLRHPAKCDAAVEEVLTIAIERNLYDRTLLNHLAILLSKRGARAASVAIWDYGTPHFTTVWLDKKYAPALVQGAKEALGEDGFAAAVAHGCGMRRAEKRLYALEAWRQTKTIHQPELLQSTPDCAEVELPVNKHGLTERELDVLQVMAKGRSNKEIAKELYLTEGTVRTYLSRVYGKLGAASRTEALLQARKFGLIDS